MTYIVQQCSHRDIKVADIQSINKLRGQLSRSGSTDPANYPELKTFLNQNLLWIVRKHGEIVAMGSLNPNIGFTRSESFGYIRNIVTEKNHRGKQSKAVIIRERYHGNEWNKTRSVKLQSLAEVIVEEMSLFARFYQYGYLELTSGPDRVAANKLYKKLGFIPIATASSDAVPHTNLYRLYLTKKKS